MPSAIQSTSPTGVHIARSGSGVGAKPGQRSALLLFAVAYVAALVLVLAPQGTFAVHHLVMG